HRVSPSEWEWFLYTISLPRSLRCAVIAVTFIRKFSFLTKPRGRIFVSAIDSRILVRSKASRLITFLWVLLVIGNQLFSGNQQRRAFSARDRGKRQICDGYHSMPAPPRCILQAGGRCICRWMSRRAFTRHRQPDAALFVLIIRLSPISDLIRILSLCT